MKKKLGILIIVCFLFCILMITCSPDEKSDESVPEVSEEVVETVEPDVTVEVSEPVLDEKQLVNDAFLAFVDDVYMTNSMSDFYIGTANNGSGYIVNIQPVSDDFADESFCLEFTTAFLEKALGSEYYPLIYRFIITPVTTKAQMTCSIYVDSPADITSAADIPQNIRMQWMMQE